jgi:hypothetical protein
MNRSTIVPKLTAIAQSSLHAVYRGEWRESLSSWGAVFTIFNRLSAIELSCGYDDHFVSKADTRIS